MIKPVTKNKTYASFIDKPKDDVICNIRLEVIL